MLQANTVISEELKALQAELEALKQNHTFKLVVRPNRKTKIRWSVNLPTATLDQLKGVVRTKYVRPERGRSRTTKILTSGRRKRARLREYTGLRVSPNNVKTIFRSNEIPQISK